MPLIKKTVKTSVVTGYKCDCCGKEDDIENSPLVVNHTMGFFSKHDMTTVSFVICDDCLHDIAKNHIPNAIIQNPEW